MERSLSTYSGLRSSRTARNARTSRGKDFRPTERGFEISDLTLGMVAKAAYSSFSFFNSDLNLASDRRPSTLGSALTKVT